MNNISTDARVEPNVHPVLHPLEQCRKGNHGLRVIFRQYSHDDYPVVRWCTTCGAIVVDTDLDGRTYPGQVMSMRIPEITRAKFYD
jgi:hypothetical protein